IVQEYEQLFVLRHMSIQLPCVDRSRNHFEPGLVILVVVLLHQTLRDRAKSRSMRAIPLVGIEIRINDFEELGQLLTSQLANSNGLRLSLHPGYGGRRSLAGEVDSDQKSDDQDNENDRDLDRYFAKYFDGVLDEIG